MRRKLIWNDGYTNGGLYLVSDPFLSSLVMMRTVWPRLLGAASSTIFKKMLNNHHRDPNKGNTNSILSVVPSGHFLTGLLIIYQDQDNITWHGITPVTITQTTPGPRVFVPDNCHKGWHRSHTVVRQSQHCGDHDIVSPWDIRQRQSHPIFGPQFNCQQHLLIFEIWFLHALRPLLPLSRSKTFIFFFMIERKLVKGSIDWQKKSWC